MLRRIGAGSYGEVWLARHEVLGTYRAVKVVYRAHFREERPFERELEGIQRFEPVSRSHPGQVSILQVGRNEVDGFFYYAMGLADDQLTGQQIDPDRYAPKTLRSELDRLGRLPFTDGLQIGLALTTALKHLHAAGLIHRDIKPSNVIFIDGLPRLADIGLVAAAGTECSLVGTEGYLAPEGPGSKQADIYALGKVLYEMGTGLKVTQYPNLPADWAQSPEHEDFNKLNQVVLRACEPIPRLRYKTAEEIESDLEFISIGKSLFGRKMQRTIQRLRWVLLGGALVVMLVLSSLGLWIYRSRAAEENRRRELREVKISRMQLRTSGWFSNDWSRLQRAAAVRKDEEIAEQASALLAEWDARPALVLPGVAAASVAFAPDGRVLIGGLGGSRTLLIDTNGVTTELPAQGEGAVCWPPDGTPLLLSAVSNGLVLHEALTGRVRKEFPLSGAAQSAVGLDITPDGTVIAAATADRLLVWRTATGEFLGEAKSKAVSLALAPDGSLLGAGGDDGTIRVYAVPDLAEVAALPPALRGNPILCLAFARDRVVRYGVEHRTNAWLLAAGDKGAGIVIWDLDRRLPRSFCRGSTWHVEAVAFSPDGLTLASAGRNEPRLWDIMSGRALLKLMPNNLGESVALAFDATGRRLVCGGEASQLQGRLTLWELESNRGIQALRGLASPVRRIWFSPHRGLVAALSDDWHVAVWQAGSGRLVFLFETPVGVLADNAAGCFDPSGERFAFVTWREACLYDLADGRVLKKWRLAQGFSDQLQFDTRGCLLLLRRERASAERASIWRLFELGASESPVLLHEQMDTNWLTADTALAQGGERFLVWHGGPKGTRRTMHAYEVSTGKELWQAATERTDGELRVWLDPTGRWFAYTAYASTPRLRVTRFSDFKEMGKTPDECFAISPSGREFLGAGKLYLEPSEAKQAIPLPTDWMILPDTSAFSPDGRTAAWGTTEGVVLIVDIQAVRQRLAGFRH